jgi:hypothetical protein
MLFALDAPEIIVGDLVFTKNRVSIVRDGRFISSFAVDPTTFVELREDRVSEHPVREFLWGIGALFVGAIALLEGLRRSDGGELVAGLLGVIVGALLL